jgi:hypothetical protein
MNKFKITEWKNYEVKTFDTKQPALFKVYFGGKMYFLHKGKDFKVSVNRLLDDISRGILGGKFLPIHKEAVAFCKRNTGLYKVSVELLLNDTPDKVLQMEEELYKEMADDPLTLNNLAEPIYKPNWMLREVFKEKCSSCMTSVTTIDKEYIEFNFCPICGRATANL